MSELEANSIKLGEAHADKMIESDAALKELREKLTGHAKEKGVVGAGLSGSEHFCQYRDWLAVATDKIDSLLAERGEIHHEINLLTERVQELSAELDYERAFASYLRAKRRVKKLEKKLPSGRIGSL